MGFFNSMFRPSTYRRELVTNDVLKLLLDVIKGALKLVESVVESRRNDGEVLADLVDNGTNVGDSAVTAGLKSLYCINGQPSVSGGARLIGEATHDQQAQKRRGKPWRCQRGQ